MIRKTMPVLSAVAFAAGAGAAMIVAPSVASASFYADAVNAANPAAYYRFNEAGKSDGQSAADATGNHHASYQGGVQNVAGPRPDGLESNNDAAQFGGTGSGTHVAGTTMGNFGSGLGTGASFAAFIHVSAGVAWDERDAIFGTFNAGNDTAFYLHTRWSENELGDEADPNFLAMNLRAEGSSQSRVGIRDSHVRDALGLDASESLLGQWWHIVAVYDHASDGSISFFVNGIEIDDTGVAHDAIVSTDTFADFANPMYIGAQNLRGDLSRELDGAVDEAAFFDRALTAAEVATLYNASLIPEPASLALLGLAGVALLGRRRQRA